MFALNAVLAEAPEILTDDFSEELPVVITQAIKSSVSSM